ncbi:hypothetical protein DOS75_00895 [Staphylococcus felis]|uniref:Uncharacterized protein n=1 Tax=Staphylococcus felis TaxID=46127 RepID=A0AAX1RV20_9STAP|nr:hypothetical protein [Staphylococcus felis]REH76192.1 hypothetical protein DOS59_08820 [Staphylococcus felis]REH83872.1 hypothetical protein DOS56_05300 [Staphylococcus felis]REH85294.1 hypothetical protein DOS63_05470 [Staphylococcus felis]REH99012.1 hypothetical protein DOS64_10075 [Staphylococcus felis]REI19516.1 hypothetical protein DOS75_00895 [Staphylococcus felis]
MKIKVKKEMNLPKLAHDAWENGVKNVVFLAIDVIRRILFDKKGDSKVMQELEEFLSKKKKLERVYEQRDTLIDDIAKLRKERDDLKRRLDEIERYNNTAYYILLERDELRGAVEMLKRENRALRIRLMSE